MRDLKYLNDTIPTPPVTYVPPGSNLFVTIGRNAGDRPMDGDRWYEFRHAVRSMMDDALDPDFLFRYEGVAEWRGVTEQSTAFFAVSTRNPVGTRLLQAHFSELAEKFGQEVIPWTFGAPNLVMSREPEPYQRGLADGVRGTDVNPAAACSNGPCCT